MQNSPTWSAYDCLEIDDAPSAAVAASSVGDAPWMPFISYPPPEQTLRGGHLKKRLALQRGGQGAVYAAEDTANGGRLVAVKRIYVRQVYEGSRGVEETTLREATLLRLVSDRQQRHLKAVSMQGDGRAASASLLDESARFTQLHRIVEAPHQELCLVMELCSIDLRRVVLSNRKKSQQSGFMRMVPPLQQSDGDDAGVGAKCGRREERRCQFLSQMSVVRYLLRRILRVVLFLHEECRIVHRDLKLSNFLITDEGALRLCDFGSARFLLEISSGGANDSTQLVAAGGESHRSPPCSPSSTRTTLLYQAPEALLGKRSYTTAHEVWSLGVIFAELLLQDHLFSSRSELEQIRSIWKLVGQPPPSPLSCTSSSPPSSLPDVVAGSKSQKSEADVAELTTITAVPIQPTLSLKFNEGVVPKEGLDLLSRMLSIIPETRITIREALQHPFLHPKGSDSNSAVPPPGAEEADAADDAAGAALWREKVAAVLAEKDRPMSCGMSLHLSMDSSESEEEGDEGYHFRPFPVDLH